MGRKARLRDSDSPSVRIGLSPRNDGDMMRNLLIAGVVVIVAGVAGFLAWQHFQTPSVTDTASAASADTSKPIDSPLAKAQPDDVVVGDANAPITMIEYSSLSCPHCA